MGPRTSSINWCMFVLAMVVLGGILLLASFIVAGSIVMAVGVGLGIARAVTVSVQIRAAQRQIELEGFSISDEQVANLAQLDTDDRQIARSNVDRK